MKVKLCVFSSFLLIASCLAQSPTDSSSVKPTTGATVTSTEAEKTSAETHSSSVSTSEQPQTTTETIITSTTKPPTTETSVTTTPTPVTTETSPTTPTQPPTTSPQTSTPKTTTNVPPSTTETPIPVPEEGFWNVTEGNTTCIRADLKVLFYINIKDHMNYIALSPNASSDDSQCSSSNVTQILQLKDSSYSLEFIFEKNSDDVYVRNISFTYRLPEGTDTVTNNSHLFNVKSGNSYLCNAPNDVVFDKNVTMKVLKIKVQAFGSAGNSGFGTVEECLADNQVSDIVPIAVGVALLALVVVVLIAYLVGRRRSRQKGYQSV